MKRENWEKQKEWERWRDRRKKERSPSVLKSWVPAPGLLALEEEWWGEELRTVVQRLLSKTGEHQCWWHRSALRHPFMSARFAGVPSQGRKQVLVFKGLQDHSMISFRRDVWASPCPTCCSEQGQLLTAVPLPAGREKGGPYAPKKHEEGSGCPLSSSPSSALWPPRQVSAELPFPYLETEDYRYS